MESIREKVRDIINDIAQLQKRQFEVFSVNGSPLNVFTLTGRNIDEDTIKVYRNSILVADTEYTFDGDTNQLTYTGTLNVTDILDIWYDAFDKYSDRELNARIKAALYYLTTLKYKEYTFDGALIVPTPTDAEEDLIAIVASILIKGNITRYSTPEFTVQFGTEGSAGLSVEDKIKMTVNQFKQQTCGVLDYIDLCKKTPEEEDCNG